MNDWLIAIGVIAALAVGYAQAQDGLQSDRPMGMFGEGHEEHHAHYLGLVNGNNGSCCNGKDGRPTQARWNGQGWDVMVNGEWRTIPPMEAYKILTPEVFARQKRERWDNQSHVFTSVDGRTIYCVIPPASGG